MDGVLGKENLNSCRDSGDTPESPNTFGGEHRRTLCPAIHWDGDDSVLAAGLGIYVPLVPFLMMS